MLPHVLTRQGHLVFFRAQVFRDQHFTQDMTSAACKRIEEARIIRSAQFVQDAGPMAHVRCLRTSNAFATSLLLPQPTLVLSPR